MAVAFKGDNSLPVIATVDSIGSIIASFTYKHGATVAYLINHSMLINASKTNIYILIS